MTKEDRKAEVLDYMCEYDIAFSPLQLYRNLRAERGINFGIDSVRNYLDELADEGAVLRVDKEAMDDGDIREAEKGSRPYYVITEAGVERTQS